MNILVLGGGAREHSICWSIKNSKKCKMIYCIPGNAGISEIAECSLLNLDDKRELLKFCDLKNIDLVIIGPEQYLEKGLSDYLIKKGILVFGPSRNASKLETSKSFAKKFLNRNKINTSDYKEFTSFKSAKKYISSAKYPLVIKADGLAAGKGVIICKNMLEAEVGLIEIMKKKKFGSAGKKIIIEDFLDGFEISYFAFFDKNNFIKLGYALDHKRAYDNDQGPNTGGMGCFSPSKKVTKSIEEQITKKILLPTLKGLKKEKLVYRGVLFFGLMITKKGPYVIEYNVRFGDPECQTLLRKLNTDLLDLILCNLKDNLSKVKIKIDNRAVICVVLAANGYPGLYKKNKIIKNLEKAQLVDGVVIYHAGTSLKNKKIVSSGGRVLSITAKAKSIKLARERAYKALRIIDWSDGFFRKDIGVKNL
ncbi:MAG: phosphoribosylamine--glycine ligase [Pseudomonadota bacterium]|nr:phosphoribosylamine--glycine ligase [Pseudomonadota bacterium]